MTHEIVQLSDGRGYETDDRTFRRLSAAMSYVKRIDRDATPVVVLPSEEESTDEVFSAFDLAFQ